MEKMGKLLRWGLFLWKRLYKKVTFLLLLVSIPLLAVCYGLTAREDSGMITVALASRVQPVEPLTREIWDELQESGLVLYVECESPEAAGEMVRRAEADTAWIFEAELEHKIYDFIAHRSRQNAFVTVLEPEDRVLLKLMREVLSGTVFPHCSQALYLQYLRENAPELAEQTDAQLLQYYHDASFDEELFLITDIEGNPTDTEQTPDYLLTPLRGLLAVVAAMGGLAAGMYYIRDEELGTFTLVPSRKKVPVELLCQLIAGGNVLAVVLVTLALTGQSVAPGRELATALLYAPCVAAFCMLLRRLTGSIRALSTLTPILAVVMLAVCPVFFDLGALRQVQLLLPPTYFIMGAYNRTYLLYMAGYTLAALGLCLVWDRLAAARRKRLRFDLPGSSSISTKQR